jgi:hypothetical protein
MTTRLEARLKRMGLAVGSTDIDYWSGYPGEEWPTRVLVFFLIGCPVTDEQASGSWSIPLTKPGPPRLNSMRTYRLPIAASGTAPRSETSWLKAWKIIACAAGQRSMVGHR